jgi:hypothetical protein
MSKEPRRHFNHLQRGHQKGKSKGGHKRGNQKAAIKGPEIKYKSVPLKNETKDPKELKTIKLKYEDIDGRTDKVSFHVFKDGSDEQFLYLVKEFKNTVYTYDLREKQHLVKLCIKISKDALTDQLEICGTKKLVKCK